MGRTVAHFCCYRTCSHARLACFLFETNQHFVGSARIVGLCFTSSAGVCDSSRVDHSLDVEAIRREATCFVVVVLFVFEEIKRNLRAEILDLNHYN